MPYSKEKNILFIHIPKCAGKSFEVAIDIATSKEVKNYKWRSHFNRFGKLILKKTKDKKALDRLWGINDYTFALQHLTYTEIELLNLLDKKTLDNAIKVAIVRNPYERALSSFFHMGENYDNFKDFLNKHYNSPNRDHNALAHKRQQIDYLRDKKGDIAVDNILRLEHLNEDFERFKNKYKINSNKIPHIGKQKDDNVIEKYYDSESKKLVKILFKDDFDFFQECMNLKYE